MNPIKFEIEIDPQPILDNLYSDGDPSRGLSNAVEEELRRQAIERITNQIKSEHTDYGYGRDWFTNTVKDEVINKVQTQISKILENWFSERNLKQSVEREVERTMDLWIEKKVMDRLEEIKSNILFYRQEDIDEMEQQHQRDLAEAYNHE